MPFLRGRDGGAGGSAFAVGISLSDVIRCCPKTKALASVARLVDESVLLDPRHHCAQLLADDLDRVLGHEAPPRQQRRRAGTVLDDEALRILTGLDVLQHL